jgi:hypothetical protein
MTLGNTTRNRFFACCLLALAALTFTANAWAQLSGTKTIGGASPDYPTIKAAIQALNAQGVAAPGVTFLIRSGTYNEDSLRIRTSTSSASAPIVFKPDVGATVVINVTPPSTAYDFAIKIDTTQYVTINGSNSGTTSRDLTINSLGTSGQRGIWVSGASHYATIKNCNINVGAGIATPTSSVIGIDFRYTGAAQNPNYVLAENNLIRYAYTGIRIEGNATGDVCESPVFRNNIIDSVANAGIYSWYFNDGRFYNNDINIKRGSSATIYGIYIGSVSARARVYNNKVHDINQLSTTSTTYGIFSSGTSTLASHAIFNNFVWGISSPATATGAIYGIYDGTGNSTIADTIAFNTVVLTGSSTGNKTTAAFYKGSSTGPAYVYNNIFHNTRTDGATGVAVAIYKVSTTTVLNSNFNNLYVGTPDAQHKTGRISTTNYTTLAEWRTANSSDAASFAENSPFVSSTDLHIQTTVPTQLESGGTPVAAITTDIDGDSRNATTPDVGADEFAGIGLDLTPPVITYTPLTNTSQTTARTLIATITDASGVPTSGIGLPRVYWRINSGAYTGVAGTFVSGNQYSFTFGAGVADGDTVSYFVAAQDNASPPNVSVFPSQGASGLTANPPAASTPPTNPSRYIVRQPLAGGDYTVGLTLFERVTGTKLTPKSFTRRVLREVPVGPEIDHKALGPTTTASITPYQRTELREVEETYSVLMDGDKPYQGPTRVMLNDALREHFGISSRVLAVYPTITAAVNDLNVRGVAGAIRFLLVDTLYTSETLPIVVQVNNDSVPTASKTVTIKPNTGVTATISGALASGPVFRILTSYIIIDGSNTTGGTTRNLTIQNTSATSPQVVVFGSLGTTPITNGTLMNCHIINGALTSTPVIISDGTTAGSPGYFSNITIKNNHIRKAYIGVYANGGAAPTQNGSNLVYESNIFTPVGADSMRYIGLYMQGVNGATVRGNEMGFFSGVSSEDDKGIWLASGTTNAVVERNYIHDLVYFGTGGYGGHGIYVSSVMTNANNVLRNNMIANMAGDGWNYATIPTDNPIGIVFSGTQTGNSAYYNSIHLFGNRLNQTDALSMGIYLGAGSEANIVNNNIINKLGFLASTGYGATGIYAVTSNTQFTNINYNNYFSDAPSPALNIIGKIGASDYTTLAAWRAASGGDTNSVSGAVNFVSPTNLHIVSYLPSVLDSAATPIAGITTDFDGETRNATRPDIGADEFTRVALPPPVISNIVRSTRVPLAGDTVVVTCTITDTLGISSANLIYNVNDTVNSAPMTLTGGTPQNGTWRGVVPGSANQNGNRVELQIQANSTSGQSTTTPKAAARSYYAGISPLSLTGLRRMHPNGRIMDSLYYARVTGTVNGPNFQTTNLGYHFQDAVGGIQLFSFGITRPPLNRGDSIIVVGRIAQFRGLTEIVPDTQTTDIQVVDTGRTVTPIEVTVAAFNANPELYESRLLRMVTLQRRDPTPPWPGPGTSANIVMYQNVVTDTIIMRIDSDTEIPGSPEPTYPVTVTGVITQFSSATSVYNNGYQTQPRYLTDLVSAPSPLSGTYTVGTGGAFPTLDSAFSALATRGVSGPVTFSLIDSLYRPTRQLSEQDLAALDVPRTVDMITDDGQVVTINPFEARGDKPLDIVGINLTGPIPGASATNRVTLRPANNVRARIVGTGPATFNFRNVSYVTFDGVGTTGPTQLAIENTAANGIAIALVGNSDNNIVQNLTLRAPYASGIGVYLDTASVAAGDSNLITGNNVPVAYFGVYVRGGNYVARGNRITNNVFGADSLGALGVYNQQVNGSVIANNLIQNVKDAVAAGGNIAGIWIATRQLNLRVYNNVVAGVSNRPGATGAVFASGIYCFGTSTDTTRSLFYNNMVYGLNNPTTSASGTIRGMYLSTGRNDTAAYNTVRLTGTDAGSIISGALYLSSAAANVTLLNNIAVNERVTTGTGRALGLYLIAAPAGLLTNYNDLYVPAQTGSHVAAVGTTNYTTLAQWQATGRDSQSVSVMPNFQAPHLHINPTIPTVLDGGAKRIASITTDIDGQTRHPLRPDIGADEFAPASFFDNFEAYNVGQQLACQNPVDWTTWSLSPCNATEDPFISSAFAYSGTKSVVIVQNNDLVKRVTADTTGVYSMTFRFYIPRTKAGYFNTLAVFTPPSTFNWGMEVYFDSTGNGRLFAGSATAFPFTFTRDAWQLARVVVDLTRDSAKFYINSTLVRTWRWTAGASGGGSPRRLAANDFYGATAWDQMYMDDYDFRPDTWTGVEETPVAVPETFSLMQNYPNPFNPTTTIRYALPKEAQVRVQVYNILGQLVAELVNDVQNAGYHNIVWNGRNQYGTQVATGVYLYRLEARPTDGSAPFVSTKKMLLVK